MMRVLIIEDEKASAIRLSSLIHEVVPDVEVLESLDSIVSVVDWFKRSILPDAVLMDIHLADGSAFEIFEHIQIKCPVIFTTAYDEYALQAFKVNSVDYLLKPIDREELKRAFEKLKTLRNSQLDESALFHMLQSVRRENYRKYFLISAKGDKLLPVSVERIDLFYIKDGHVSVVLVDGAEYTLSQTLEEVVECIDPDMFYRLNRQFLIAREAVKDIDLWFGGRLSVNLRHPVLREKILVSKAKVQEFKQWFSGQ